MQGPRAPWSDSCDIPRGDRTREGTVLIRTDIAEITDAARLDAFMRRLELSGNVLHLRQTSPEEEEAVRARLRELGYL